MTPIVYASTIAVRFSDLDPYGHVNSARYLDYIISSRFEYSRRHLDVTDQTLVAKGIGFFLTHAESRFLRPIQGVQELDVRSWVESIEGAELRVPYEIRLSNDKVASEGQLKFAVIDLKTQRPTAPPDWVVALFMKGAA